MEENNMKREKHIPVKIIQVSLILLLILVFSILIDIDNTVCANTGGGNNKINVVNRQQVINILFEGQMENFQGDMEISWKSKGNPGESDVKFTITDLALVSGDDDNVIPSEAILIKVKENEKGSLNYQRKVLSKGENDQNEIKFKIDDEEIDWDDVPPGTYKGEINIIPNYIELSPPSNSNHGSLELTVEVNEVQKINLSSNEINWTIEEPNKAENQYSQAVTWELVNDPGGITIQFSSIGSEEGTYNLANDDEDYKDFFEYIVSNENSDVTYTFTPGEKDIEVSSYTEGKVKLKYRGDIAKDRWTELNAGDYHDVVEIIISSE